MNGYIVQKVQKGEGCKFFPIKKNGTIYWIGGDYQLHGYSSLADYNSWHMDNDFSKVVPANAADMSLPVGSVVSPRVLQ